MNYYQLSVFNGDHFASYQEALAVGAVYETPSTIDVLCADVKTGILDAIEMLNALATCADQNHNFIYGVVLENGDFITLQQLAEA